MKYKVTVDRIEGDTLVCIDENAVLHRFKKDALGCDLCEGDVFVLELSQDGKVLFSQKEQEEAEKKKAEMKTRLSRLFKDKNN